MNKEELETFVTEMYGMYNKDLFEADRKPIMRGWYQVLEDVTLQEAQTQLRHIGNTEKYMPNAPTLRRKIQEARTQNPPPTPVKIWAYITTLQKNAQQGTPTENTPTANHPCTKQLIQELGPTIWNLKTNQDREFILTEYAEICYRYIFTVEEEQ